MKHLVLCRHAKSSWKYPVEDCYRPLNKRGLLNAVDMARCLANEELNGKSFDCPQLILCSHSVRTYATALAYIEENRWPISVLSLEPLIYEASGQTLLSILAKVKKSVNSLWLVAHNPGLNLLAEYLLGKELENIVTSAQLHISLDIENWKELLEQKTIVSKSKLVHWLQPSML
ncbi:hypothetical protein KIH87_07750 [Paraneptunicella aestuarii]|uniref:SixA phosphatase family protein n=1 Tax=Paraneptunicella aestuarii TaxID=2831148 RepID=UPI001E363A04|nr:hypothetical protein [Paraneptunicella aestuarii]UAA40223.1 hypothetical protein KIH87_07750 [Paraneptunicella aestuarii]